MARPPTHPIDPCAGRVRATERGDAPAMEFDEVVMPETRQHGLTREFVAEGEPLLGVHLEETGRSHGVVCPRDLRRGGAGHLGDLMARRAGAEHRRRLEHGPDRRVELVEPRVEQVPRPRRQGERTLVGTGVEHLLDQERDPVGEAADPLHRVVVVRQVARREQARDLRRAEPVEREDHPLHRDVGEHPGGRLAEVGPAVR